MMKKVFPLIIICVFLITGCGEKKLECNASDSSNGVELKTKIVAKFKKGLIKTLDMELDNNLENYSGSSQYYISVIKKVYDTYNDLEGVDVTFDEKDSNIKVIIKVDVDHMTGKSLEKFNFFDLNGEFKNLKSEFEAKGYTCK